MPPIPECQTERQRDGAQIFLERQEPPNSQNLHSTAQAFAFPVRTKQVKVNVTRAIGSLREWQQKSMKDRVEGLGDRSNSQNAENKAIYCKGSIEGNLASLSSLKLEE